MYNFTAVYYLTATYYLTTTHYLTARAGNKNEKEICNFSVLTKKLRITF